MISPEWINDDKYQTPLIACLIDERIEVSPDLSELLKIYDVNEEYPHWSVHPDRYYEDQLPIFFLLDKHMYGTGDVYRTEEWILPRLQILVQHEVDFNVHRRDEESRTYPNVTTPLYIAMVHLGSLPLANIMIENGANIRFQRIGYEPILCSLVKLQSWRPRMDVIRFALEKGADPNDCDEDGLTPLILGIRANVMCAVCALLNNGADPFMKSQPDDLFGGASETTPLEMASKRGHTHCLLECIWHIEKKLRETEYFVEERLWDVRGKVVRPLLWACASGGLSCFEPLMVLYMRCNDGPYHKKRRVIPEYVREEQEVANDQWKTNLLYRSLYIACKSARTDIIMYCVKSLMADF